MRKVKINLWDSQIGKVLSGKLDMALYIFTDDGFVVLTGDVMPSDSILKIFIIIIKSALENKSTESSLGIFLYNLKSCCLSP